ncbi:hypothetical protein [Bacillus sp. V2I10]|nr:hypothetical protein [Bacillus sp. V2I10]MDQ0860623.1 hypothetical protein [Bacillus sp. V2I10]
MKKCIRWNLYSEETNTTLKKNCKMCGRSSILKETLVRRHNANGE